MNEFIRLTISFKCNDPYLDIISHELMSHGYLGCQEEDHKLHAFVDAHLFEEDQIRKLKETYPDAGIEYILEKEPDRNWNKYWESNYDPVQIGDQVYIHAPFHQTKNNVKYSIQITPKMSFGTGHHPTTQMMIRSMLETNFQNALVLDVGCGSGILSILAEKLGASEILAIDIDDRCIENSRENISLNSSLHVNVVKGNVAQVSQNGYNIILANINRNTIIKEINTYHSLLSKGGCLIISGFIEADLEIIGEAAKKVSFSELERRNIKEWHQLKFSKDE